MKRVSSLLVVMALVMAFPVGLAQAKTPLHADTTHVLVVTPVFDGPYMLAWQGQVSGDINGTIEWWIDTSTWTMLLKPDSPAQASHYTMKTRIYDAGGALILETLEDGTTTIANETWRANGIITYADDGLFPGWEGRSVHERGEFTMAVFPWTGTSTFRVN